MQALNAAAPENRDEPVQEHYWAADHLLHP
jgi:hypothetical protein